MVLITGNWRIAMAGLVASLLIFGVLFFTVIKPSENTANQALRSGLQQTQQALNQAQKQTTGQAQTALNQTTKLAGCLASAGIDPSKIQACQASYGH